MFARMLVRSQALVLAALLALLAIPAQPSTAAPPRTLTLGVVQMANEPTLAGNRDRIIRFIAEAKARGCRVVVFPEGALRAKPEDEPVEVEAAVQAIRRAADDANIYVVMGGHSRDNDGGKAHNWMVVVDPDGRQTFRYQKLYDRHEARMPEVFYIDGIPCSAFICADRWLRGLEELPVMEGSRLLFELSNNFEMEWVSELGWYWYVPRALRNQTFVVFSNSGKHPGGFERNEHGPYHGHSAVINPDGSFLAAIKDNSERMIVTTIDLSKATAVAAKARFSHPVFEPFWKAGFDIRAGKPVSVPTLRAYTSPALDIKIAGAQMACSRQPAENVSKMRKMIAEAAANGADLVVFPELAVTGAMDADIRRATAEELSAAVDQLRQSAKEHRVHVVFGTPQREGSSLFNSAIALGPDGSVLTRYDQMAVDRRDLFKAGSNPKSMWFRVKGVPAVVTIGKDGLWSEIAELAAHAGAQIHAHIEYDRSTGEAADLRRMQIWANLASYKTFTPSVNAASPAGLKAPGAAADGGSVIWDDLRGIEEVRAALKALQPNADPSVHIFSPWSANAVVKAGHGEQIIYATRRVNAANPYRQPRFNPQMKPWFDFGANLITPGPKF